MPAPVHVGLVGSACWPIIGGMEIYLHEAAQALRRRGHAVTIATRFTRERPAGMKGLLTTSEPARRYDEDGVRVQVVAPEGWHRGLLWPAYRLHFYPSLQPLAIQMHCAALYEPLRAALAGCDVVHYSGTGRELLGFCAARVAAALGVPFVVTPHMHADAWGDGPLDFDLYRRADRVIALTAFEKDHAVQRGLAEEAVRVIGHGVNVQGTGDGDRFRQAHGIDGPLVLFLGRKSAYKGYPLLLEAAPRVWKTHPETHFALVGPAEHGPPDAAAHVLRDPRVHDLGTVSNAEREDAYAACDVFCLPSRAEAFGLVYLEAWHYGAPVVALGIPTLTELIGEAEGGLLAEPVPSSVVAALTRLLGDATLRQRLGTNGHARAQQQSWDNVAERLATVYRTAAAPQVRAPAARPAAISA